MSDDLVFLLYKFVKAYIQFNSYPHPQTLKEYDEADAAFRAAYRATRQEKEI